MGNNKSRETSFSRQASDVIQPHSALLDIVLTELLYCSELIQVFNAYNLNVKEASNVHILNYGFSIQGKEMENESEKWIPSYQQLHHPWVLKILSNKIIQKEIGFKNHSSLVVLTEEYTISLAQILQSMMKTSPATLRKIKSFSQIEEKGLSNLPIITLKRSKSEEKIVVEKKFAENAIFKMLFMIIDALIYCYEKGFVMRISESNVVYCNKSDRFLISPFALVEDKEPVSVITLDALFQNPDSAPTKKSKKSAAIDQDGDISFQKDLIIKKQIFNVGVLGLKMASLKPLSKNPKDIKKALTEIKADFPGLYVFLNMALYEIFRDHFELRKLLSHPLYDCVYSTKLSFQTTTNSKNLKSSMQFGKTYNLFENSEASLQCFQKVMSDLTSKKQMSLREEIEYSQVLQFTAEGYLQSNFVDQAKLYINKCLDILDKIAITSKQINLSEIYCEVARLCLNAADVSLAILVLEKASKNYFENHQLEDQSMTEIRLWQEIEFKLYELKKPEKGEPTTSTISNLERLAELSWALENVTSALEYRKILIKLYEKDSNGSKNNFWKIGEIFMKLFEYDEALKAHEKCLLLKTSQPDEPYDSILKSLMRIGQVYEYKFDYGKAIITYQKAIDLTQKVGLAESVRDLHIMDALARCYESFGDLDGSLKWLEEIVSTLDQNISELNGDYVSKIYEIARILELQRNYSEAFKYYQKCVEIIAKNHLDEQELFSHSNKAILRLTNFLQSSMT